MTEEWESGLQFVFVTMGIVNSLFWYYLLRFGTKLNLYRILWLYTSLVFFLLCLPAILIGSPDSLSAKISAIVLIAFFGLSPLSLSFNNFLYQIKIDWNVVVTRGNN
eukprot:TRINITY_DN3114_c0_g1_i8.p2 TRINITY_DN3114_c0_g1~~TRINITY_DN3114_c0_g1_i8.p2  ORF type:complete len:107 (+),score=19.33 TRINITY_DN3114_c0_g1_i8:424-744(+)